MHECKVASAVGVLMLGVGILCTAGSESAHAQWPTMDICGPTLIEATCIDVTCNGTGTCDNSPTCASQPTCPFTQGCSEAGAQLQILCDGDRFQPCAEYIPQCSEPVPPFVAVSTGGCNGTSVITCDRSDNGGDGSPGYPLIVTDMFTATDDCGNTAVCSRTITVVDDTPPGISGPRNLTVATFADLPACDDERFGAYDDCSGQLPIECIRQSLGGLGCTDEPIRVTYLLSATDAAGNRAERPWIVTVERPDCPIPTWVLEGTERPVACACHGDPICDGAVNVLDVVMTVGVAFRGEAAPSDPTCAAITTDADCNGTTNVLDVVRFVNVAFRGGDPAAEFKHTCNP